MSLDPVRSESACVQEREGWMRLVSRMGQGRIGWARISVRNDKMWSGMYLGKVRLGTACFMVREDWVR